MLSCSPAEPVDSFPLIYAFPEAAASENASVKQGPHSNSLPNAAHGLISCSHVGMEARAPVLLRSPPSCPPHLLYTSHSQLPRLCSGASSSSTFHYGFWFPPHFWCLVIFLSCLYTWLFIYKDFFYVLFRYLWQKIWCLANIFLQSISPWASQRFISTRLTIHPHTTVPTW